MLGAAAFGVGCDASRLVGVPSLALEEEAGWPDISEAFVNTFAPFEDLSVVGMTWGATGMTDSFGVAPMMPVGLTVPGPTMTRGTTLDPRGTVVTLSGVVATLVEAIPELEGTVPHPEGTGVSVSAGTVPEPKGTILEPVATIPGLERTVPGLEGGLVVGVVIEGGLY